jgi:4a-hydroxytetrahydrobiopterin dehydratase
MNSQFLVDQTKIESAMISLPKWFLVGNKKITREFGFENFDQAFHFVNKLSRLARLYNHHPDICIYFNKVEITLCTHAIGGLSEADFVLAEEIDKLV